MDFMSERVQVVIGKGKSIHDPIVLMIGIGNTATEEIERTDVISGVPMLIKRRFLEVFIRHNSKAPKSKRRSVTFLKDTAKGKKWLADLTKELTV